MSSVTDGLTSRILNIQREIRAIKIAYYGPSSTESQIKALAFDKATTITNACRITYANGDDPIVTYFDCAGSVTASQPDMNTNTQVVQFDCESPMEVKIISTRKIVKIEPL